MKQTVLKSLQLYKKLVSPLAYKLLGHGCRFTPTCSEYSYTAIKRYGLKHGVRLSLLRILSCHPFSKRSFLDPVPEQLIN